jgi:hypothetical protein
METQTSYAGMILLLSLLGITLLYLGFKRYKHHFLAVRNRRRAKKIVDDIESELSSIPSNEMAGSDEFAAIATAIHLYHSELHDEEITVMTINKIARAYSPWCSKLYFQNQYFNLRRR